MDFSPAYLILILSALIDITVLVLILTRLSLNFTKRNSTMFAESTQFYLLNKLYNMCAEFAYTGNKFFRPDVTSDSYNFYTAYSSVLDIILRDELSFKRQELNPNPLRHILYTREKITILLVQDFELHKKMHMFVQQIIKDIDAVWYLDLYACAQDIINGANKHLHNNHWDSIYKAYELYQSNLLVKKFVEEKRKTDGENELKTWGVVTTESNCKQLSHFVPYRVDFSDMYRLKYYYITRQNVRLYVAKVNEEFVVSKELMPQSVPVDYHDDSWKITQIT
jgi:hypothetical protein